MLWVAYLGPLNPYFAVGLKNKNKPTNKSVPVPTTPSSNNTPQKNEGDLEPKWLQRALIVIVCAFIPTGIVIGVSVLMGAVDKSRVAFLLAAAIGQLVNKDNRGLQNLLGIVIIACSTTFAWSVGYGYFRFLVGAPEFTAQLGAYVAALVAAVIASIRKLEVRR